VTRLRAVTQFAALRRVQKARAGEVRFPAHDAVEFGCVAARFVNLQRDLRAAQYHVGNLGRTLRRGEETVGLFADAFCILAQRGRAHDFPAAGLIQADIAGKGSLLRLPVADGQRLDRRPALIERLRDTRTRGRIEFLVRAPQFDARARRGHALRHVHGLFDLEQERHAFADRNRRGIDLDRRRVDVDVTLGRRFAEAECGDGRAGSRDRHGPGGGGVDTGVSGIVACRKAPGAVEETRGYRTRRTARRLRC
jgi:hypothetical protein